MAIPDLAGTAWDSGRSQHRRWRVMAVSAPASGRSGSLPPEELGAWVVQAARIGRRGVAVAAANLGGQSLKIRR